VPNITERYQGVRRHILKKDFKDFDFDLDFDIDLLPIWEHPENYFQVEQSYITRNL
jgi:hypothetical protein